MLCNLRYVVVDECHAYRDVLGANVTQVLHHLPRLSREYGVSLTVIFVSVTTNDPVGQVRRLTSEPVETVTEDNASVDERTTAPWESGLLLDLQGENGVSMRRPAPTEAADIIADLPVENARTLTFTRSWSSAEKVTLGVRECLEKRRRSNTAERVESYRVGYLAEERHDVGCMLDDGALLDVTTTSALELGIDVDGLDAVVQAGSPGTVASF